MVLQLLSQCPVRDFRFSLTPASFMLPLDDTSSKDLPITLPLSFTPLLIEPEFQGLLD